MIDISSRKCLIYIVTFTQNFQYFFFLNYMIVTASRKSLIYTVIFKQNFPPKIQICQKKMPHLYRHTHKISNKNFCKVYVCYCQQKMPHLYLHIYTKFLIIFFIKYMIVTTSRKYPIYIVIFKQNFQYFYFVKCMIVIASRIQGPTSFILSYQYKIFLRKGCIIYQCYCKQNIPNLHCHISTKFPTENVVKYIIVTASRIYLIYIVILVQNFPPKML